jgi:hypothetical protein
MERWGRTSSCFAERLEVNARFLVWDNHTLARYLTKLKSPRGQPT